MNRLRVKFVSGYDDDGYNDYEWGVIDGYVNYDSDSEVLIQPNWEWEINEEHDIVTLTSDLPFVFFNHL